MVTTILLGGLPPDMLYKWGRDTSMCFRLYIVVAQSHRLAQQSQATTMGFALFSIIITAHQTRYKEGLPLRTVCDVSTPTPVTVVPEPCSCYNAAEIESRQTKYLTSYSLRRTW